MGEPGSVEGGLTRVVAANLTSGNFQSYDLGHGIRILEGLDADVVLLQEMNYGENSSAELDALASAVCEGECHYIRGPAAQIPNGIVSRLPFLACGSWTDPYVSNRDFVWARLDAPGEGDLWAISVHLLAGSAGERADEVAALLEAIEATIPPGDRVVLGGDLNTGSRSENAVDALGVAFATQGPYPADQSGNTFTNEPRSEPYDWVLADDELQPKEVPVQIGANTFDAGAVIDTRTYTPLEDLAPAQLGDSGAPSMQHMAVVKDFLLEP